MRLPTISLRKTLDAANSSKRSFSMVAWMERFEPSILIAFIELNILFVAAILFSVAASHLPC